MKRLALALILATGPALAQQPLSVQQQMQRNIAQRIGTLEMENAALQAEVADLRAENEKLKAQTKSSDAGPRP